jgi:ribosomal protein L23
MKIEPILTEKSLAEVKKGRYTFKVDNSLTKHQIRKLINETFGVHVTKIRTANEKKVQKRNLYGNKKTVMPRKKATVRLQEKEHIEVFGETKKGKKKK